MKIEQIAQIAHEVNRAYCRTMQDLSQEPWETAADWQKASAVNGVKFHLAELQAGRDPDPGKSHQNWMKVKQDEGWIWGPVKDAEKRVHPCMVAYEFLPLEQRLKDHLFCAVVKTAHQIGEISD